MNILFLGNFEAEYSSENYYKKTFQKLGHNVDCLQEGRTHAPYMRAVIQEKKIDLFFWVHTHGWPVQGIVEFLKELKLQGIPSAAFHLDLYMGLERWKQYEHSEYFHVEHFFTVDILMAQWLNENTSTKGHFLPAGVFEDECFIVTPNREKYPHDVIFTGSKGYHPEWPYRPKLIDWLHSTYGDKFGHYGGGGLPTVRGPELNNLYASAKVVIGDTLCKDFNYEWYTSDRLFESCGRGAFLIYPEIKGLETFYEPNKEVVFYEFGNFGQLKRLIDEYLEAPIARDTAIDRAYMRTKSEHTYTHRLSSMLKTIGL